MLPDDLDEGGMLSVRDVIEQWNSSRSAKHAKHSVNLSSEHCTLRQLLTSKSSLINLNWPWEFNIRQHFRFNEQTTRFPNELKVLNDLIPIPNYILS